MADVDIGNFDLPAIFDMSSTNEQYHFLNFRQSNGFVSGGAAPQDGYSVIVLASFSELSIVERVSGVEGTPVTVAKTWNANPWNLRLQAIGSALKVKVWQGAEPGTWDIETTDATHTSGDISFSSANGNSTTNRPITWDNLLVFQA